MNFIHWAIKFNKIILMFLSHLSFVSQCEGEQGNSAFVLCWI